MNSTSRPIRPVARGAAFHQRREFLRRAGALSLAGIASPWALNLAAMGEDNNDKLAAWCAARRAGPE